MKKILEVINLASSAENFIGNQFSVFSEKGGYEMHLVCSDGDDISSLANNYGVHCKVIPINRSITPIQDIKTLIEICKYIRQNKFDIIISHQEKGNLLGQIAGFITGVPIRIVYAHGVLYESMFGMKRQLIKLQDKFVSKLSTNVICVSDFVLRTRLNDGVDCVGKSVLLNKGSSNGIDIKNQFNPSLYVGVRKKLRNEFDIQESDFVIGFCGRIVKDKGIEELVEAHRILVEQNPSITIKLFVIGRLETRDGISQDSVKYLQKNPNVIFTDQLPYSQIQQYYLPMDVFVLPSHRDGLGMTPLEAQAMEVPAIVTDFTGCAETIQNGVTGEYINLDPTRIAEVISHFFNKERSVEMGKKGRDFVCKNFNREDVNNNMLEYINSLWQTKLK